MNLRNSPLRHAIPALALLVPARPTAAARRLLAVLLIATIGPVAPLLAQVSAAPGQGAPQTLHITILDGEDAINNIRERTAREPIVQVEDQNHKPVAGALLLFTIQGGPNGAGATFNGLNSLSVTTDAEGRATAHGLTPNGTEGSYSIAVSASLGTLVATSIIKQSNSAAGAGGGATPPSATPPSATPPSATAPSASAPSASASGPFAPLTHASRLAGVFKSPWLFGAVGVVAVTVVVRTVVISGRSPTSITPGTGTVGAP